MAKNIILILLLAPVAVVSAQSLSIGALPESPYADTEVSTNVAFALDFARLAVLHLSLECDATATNSLEVTIGHDANGDGRLAIEETDLAFGYDCGEWLVRDDVHEAAASGAIALLPAHDAGAAIRREMTVRRRAESPQWNLIRVSRRGSSNSATTVTVGIENKKFVLMLR